MKVLGSIVTSTMIMLSLPVWAIAADLDSNAVIVSQNSSDTANGQDEEEERVTTISIERVDLRQPHILRVQGNLNNSPLPMQQVEVKMNGKVVKKIANSSLELNLAPMMTAGRYEVEVAGTISRSDAAILLNFTGTHVNVNQQSSGSGKIGRKLIINVQ